jgi:hypothetical protein
MRITSTAIPAIILATLSFACGHSEPTSREVLNINSDLSQRCVQALSELAKAPGFTLSTDRDRMRIGNDELRLRARIENDQRAEGRQLIGLVVDVSVNGILEPFTAGSVGIGATRNEALQTAIDEWAQLAGIALLETFGIKKPESTPLTRGPFSVHRGASGIRGAQDVTWPAERERQLLDALNPVVLGLESSPAEFHSILITVVVDARGVTRGECRMDGRVSQAVLKAAQTFQWTTTSGTYMFKQFYVLRRMK